LKSIKAIESNRRRVKKHTENKRLFISAYKAEKGCRFCGEKNPVCLDLHHIGIKHKKLIELHSNWQHLTWDETRKELNEVEVLCANCHRKIHSRNKI